ncbi:hypothetical protein L2E82_45414 [Cichorium intybus]|uniref:Uncharacterized protein n=1 Tax=Cichorium intybus TaxID=13427 RepID=A0ACB8ZST8_CICIN|nr:hypothetical protein L2E82_45414 [Cichorium intybus]
MCYRVEPYLFEKKKDKLMCMYIDYGESDILETRLNMSLKYLIDQKEAEYEIAKIDGLLKDFGYEILYHLGKADLTGRILDAISGRSLKLEARTWINCWKMVISKQIRARCAQGPGGVRPGAVRPSPGAVWDKMVVVHAKARNNRDLNATSIQIVENWCGLMAMIPGVEPKLIRLLTELCSSYRLLNVPAGVFCFKSRVLHHNNNGIEVGDLRGDFNNHHNTKGSSTTTMSIITCITIFSLISMTMPVFLRYVMDNNSAIGLTTPPWDAKTLNNISRIDRFRQGSGCDRRAIQDYQQKTGEAFHDAFDRLKELLRSCPHHEVSRWQLVKIFFDGMDETNQAMINASSSGTFIWQEPEDAWKFLEQLSLGSKVSGSMMDNTVYMANVEAENKWKKEIQSELSAVTKKSNQQRDARQPPVRQQNVQPVPQGGITNISTKEIYEIFLKLKEAEDAYTQAILTLGNQLMKMEKQREQEKVSPQKAQVNEVIMCRSGKKVDNKVTAPIVEEDNDVVIVFDEKEELEKEEKKAKEKQEKKKEPASKWEKGETSGTTPFQRLWKSQRIDHMEMCIHKKHILLHLPKKIELIEYVSSIIMDTLPPKMKDPGAPLISVDFGDVHIKKALLDLGASVNILPGQLFDKHEFGTLRPTDVILQLADKSTKILRGVLSDVIIKVGNFYYPADFLPMQISTVAWEKWESPSGTNKLRLIQQYTPEVLQQEAVEFPEEEEGVNKDDNQEEGKGNESNSKECSHIEKLLTEIPKTLKPSLQEPPTLELKPLPTHLKYVFLGEKETLPVILSADLTLEQEKALLEVLSKHKRILVGQLRI